MADRGFILQPTYRTVDGRAVVHLFGILEDGSSFLVRDDRQAPELWIRSDDAERVRQLAERPEISDPILRSGVERSGRAGTLENEPATIRALEPTAWRTFDGFAASRVEMPLPRDVPPLRDRLARHGVATYEADIRFATRYLIDRGIRGALEIDGAWTAGKVGGRSIDRIYDRPELRPSDWTPALSVLSIDIETDMEAKRLHSIGLHSNDPPVAEVLLYVPDGGEAPEGAVRFLRRRDLLPALVRRVREIDPDVVTGWNVVDFDLRVLDRIARSSGVWLDLGRGGGRLRLRRSNRPRSSWEVSIPGRVVLDGIDLLRDAFIKMDSYSLGSVAREVLGEGKLIEGSDRGAKIQEAFADDRQLLVDYNLQDARLVTEILERLHVVELAVERSKLTGLPLERVAGSIAAFDFLYLGELHRRGLVAPSVGSAKSDADGDVNLGDINLGGHVLEPEPGLYENVLVFDFKSLYPSIMRTFGVDPLAFDGLRPRSERSDTVASRETMATRETVVAPNGAVFRRIPEDADESVDGAEAWILPALLDDLFPRREAAKAAGDKVASHAIKILMNSFYGVLGTTACRFAHPAIAGAITAWGRELLLETRDRCEAAGHRVLYGDTDSLFVLAGVQDPAEARALGVELGRRLDREIGEHIAARWGVESRLELELEKLYRRLLLQETRGGGGGARKRYAGLVVDPNHDDGGDGGGGGEIEYVGLEVVRRDWTELAKRLQRQLYEQLFRADGGPDSVRESLRATLEQTVDALRRGAHDDLLVYRKALRKDLREYTATTPPHVAAARKLSGPPPRVMRYVITTAGPEPADEATSPLDHEHYVQKQVRPIAEPVLRHLDLDFDRAIGDDTQMSLF